MRNGMVSVHIWDFDEKSAKGKLTFCGTPCLLQKLSGVIEHSTEVKS